MDRYDCSHRHAGALMLALACTAGASAGGPCDCSGDLNLDGVVGAADLSILLGAWGGKGTADIDGSGVVDAADLSILLGAWGLCPPPQNDTCVGGAQGISTAAPEVWVPFCTAAATTGPDPLPTPSCGSNVTIGKDVWFWRQTMDAGKVIIDLCDADFDTVVAVYRQAGLPNRCHCPPHPAMQVIACNDDSTSCGFQSSLEFDVGEDDCLMIRVGGYTYQNGTIAAGSGILHLREIHRGDRCDIAHELPSQTMVTAYGDTYWDTWQDGDLTSCATNDTQDEWYRYVMPCDGILHVSTCHPSTTFDTTLAVFSGCGTGQLACNDDSTDPGCALNDVNLKSKVSVNATAGEVLYIRVSGWNGATGSFELSLHASCIQ